MDQTQSLKLHLICKMPASSISNGMRATRFTRISLSHFKGQQHTNLLPKCGQ